MASIVWDPAGQKLYETGVDQGVLYLQNADGTYGVGEGWNGLTNVTETPSGAEETKLYANNKKYLAMRSAEDVGGTIQAYTYPKSWEECDGSKTLAPGVHVTQQARRAFGLTYRTRVGNDVKGDDYGYKLHLIYNATVSPSERAYATINDSPEAIQFSWEFATTPVDIPKTIGDFRPTSCVTINSTELTEAADEAKLKALEDMLYGTENTDPSLPSIAEVYDMFKVASEGGDDTPVTPTYTYTAVGNDATFDENETYYVLNNGEYEVDADVTALNFDEKKSTLYTRDAQLAG